MEEKCFLKRNYSVDFFTVKNRSLVIAFLMQVFLIILWSTRNIKKVFICYYVFLTFFPSVKCVMHKDISFAMLEVSLF